MPDESQQRRIRVTCPHCGAVASAPAEYAGRRVKCSAAACRQSFQLPPRQEASGRAAREAPAASNTGRQRPDRSRAVAPYASDDYCADVAPPRQQTAFSATVASNPGNIRFNPLQWWRWQPLWPALGVGFALAMFALWLGLTLTGRQAAIPTKTGGETPIWLFGAASLATLAFFTWNASRKFRSGDANPGVVVALNPTLIAVPTDLTQGAGEYPALKIVAIKLQTACGEPLRIGSRLPTVAVYAQAPSKQAGHWSDFDPTPAEYATADRSVLERLMASFPAEQYAFVEHALALIEKPLQPGLYALWPAPGKPPGRRIAKAADF